MALVGLGGRTVPGSIGILPSISCALQRLPLTSLLWLGEENPGVQSWLGCAVKPAADKSSSQNLLSRAYSSNATYHDLYKYLESLQQGGQQSPAAPEAQVQQTRQGSPRAPRTRTFDPNMQRGSIEPGRLHPRRRTKSQIQPQFLADALWAYAKVKHHNDQLFLVSARYLLKCNLYSLSIGAATKLVWAYATMQIHYERLFMELANVLLRKAHDLSEKYIADVLWAYGEVRQRDVELFRQLAAQCVQLVPKLSLEQLVKIVWAYAEVKQGERVVFDAFSEPLQNGVQQMTTRQLADVAWAYTSLGFKDPVLDAVAAAAKEKVGQFKPLEWDRLLAAFTTANHPATADLVKNATARAAETSQPAVDNQAGSSQP